MTTATILAALAACILLLLELDDTDDDYLIANPWKETL